MIKRLHWGSWREKCSFNQISRFH